MNSRDYWKKREDEARKNTIRDEREYNKRLNEIYQYMIANIERQVNNWYANYASKEGITMAEARGRVRHIDMERYERLAAKYVATHDFSEQANQEMALYNLTMKVNRLELLKAEINLELMAGFDDIEHEMRRDLIETAMKEDRRLAGILGDSVIGNEEYAKQLVNASFRNATFSERIWGKNMPDLRVHLEAELRNGLVQGIGSVELARRFRKHYGGSVKDTERLMATEMCRLQTAVQKESFERNGYKEYMFITSGDESVCPDCQALHGQHFKVSEMQAGVNAPPMHPRCHCSAASYMDSDKYKRWIDALANGEDVRWNEFEAENDRPRQPEINVSQMSASEADSVGRGVIYKHWEKYRQKFLGHAAPVDFNRLDTSMYDKVNLGAYKDKETVSKILTTVNNLSSDFYSPLQGLRWMDKTESMFSRAFASTTHMWGYGSAEIRFNPVKLSEKGIERIAELSANGYAVNIPKGREVEYIVTHEFGHSILNIGEKLPTKSNNFVQCDLRAVKAARNEIEKLWDSYTADVGKASKEYEEMRKALDSKFIFEMIPPTDEERKALSELKATMESKRISAYSMSNMDEFVAEAFADVRINEQNASEHSKQVYGVLSKYFGKGGE